MKRILHRWSLLFALGAATVAGGACSDDDTTPAATVNIPQNTVQFKAFDTEPQTVTVEANYEWTFEVTGDTQICDVTRAEGSDALTITPKPNYDNVPHTATITVRAGEGSGAASKTITVSQEANGTTYLTLLNSDLTGDNPIVSLANDPSGNEYEIRLTTNNKLTLKLSDDQTTGLPEEKPEEPAAETASPEVKTRVEIEGCEWVTYELSEETSDEGTFTVVTLQFEANEDMEKSRTAFLEVVSGEGTQNEVLSKRIGFTQMSQAPTIVVNPEELTFTYDATESQTFTMVTNLEYVETEEFNNDEKWVEFSEPEISDGVRTYTVSVKPYFGTSERNASMQFSGSAGDETVYESVKVIQTAAPKASVSVETDKVTFLATETSEKYVKVTTNYPSAVKTDIRYDNESGEWLTATYDAELEALALKPTGTDENDRTAVVTVVCGDESNSAQAIVTVTQLGTKPSLRLEVSEVQLVAEGTEQSIGVTTNQETWTATVEDPQATWCHVTADVEKGVLKVSAAPMTEAGSRETKVLVKTGDLEVSLTVRQNNVYKVGDFYVVNGKTLGVVYKVTDGGLHGKAFSLEIRNRGGLATKANTFFDGGYPESRTNGKANRDIFKNQYDWENECQVTKWVDDLAKKDGVDWYLPSIEELKELAEYMSGGLQFGPLPTNPSEASTGEGIYFSETYTTGGQGEGGETTIELYPEIRTTAFAGWDKIRNLYQEYGADASKYIVFLTEVDAKYETTDFTDPTNAGDDLGSNWLSSTMVDNGWGGYTTAILSFSDSEEYTSGVIETTNMSTGGSWVDEYSGSIHPILSF